MDPVNHEEYDQTARALLTEDGLDPDDVNKVCAIVVDVLRALLTEDGLDPEDVNNVCDIVVDAGTWSATPMLYYCCAGNFKMCRYLAFRGADGRTVDAGGWFPLYYAAMAGHLEIMEFLCTECGAHDDIRKQTRDGWSPLRIALYNGHIEVVQWLILNGALGGFLSDMMCVYNTMVKRQLLLSWAETHEDFRKSFLMGTHPKSSSSPVFKLRGKDDALKIVADYVGIPKPQEFHFLHQLMHRLNNYRRVLVRIIVFGVVLSFLLVYLGWQQATRFVVTCAVIKLLHVLFDRCLRK